MRTQMNTRLLRKVAKHIAEEPKRFIMGQSIVKGSTVTDSVRDAENNQYVRMTVHPPCGTAACIAGWTLLLSGYDAENFLSSYGVGMNFWGSEGINQAAIAELGISDRQASRLFHVEGWEPSFRKQFLSAKTPKGRAGAALRQIEHFIKTKGKE